MNVLTKDDLSKLISQIKRYDLVNVFRSADELEDWLYKLSSKQIKNFNSLDVDPAEISFLGKILIDTNLLKYDDYKNRIMAMSKLNGFGENIKYYFENLCSPIFLESQSFYEDIDMISKCDNEDYSNIVSIALGIINDKNFVASKYHKEDLALIVGASDISRRCDRLVASALAGVACNIDSINSPYHRYDMATIAFSSSKCLRFENDHTRVGLNDLATNENSLNSDSHILNMQMLSSNPIGMKYLYALMTSSIEVNDFKIKIDYILRAKSFLKAAAMYYFFTNCVRDVIWYDIAINSELDKVLKENEKEGFSVNEYKGLFYPKLEAFDEDSPISLKNYLGYLKLLNSLDDKIVMHIALLLRYRYFNNCGNKDYFLTLLCETTDLNVFSQIYKLMYNKTFLSNPHSKEDLMLIINAQDYYAKNYLIRCATDENNINSSNHRYDMEYIAKFDFTDIADFNNSKRVPFEYYLFNPNGINAKNHVDALERLARGENVEVLDSPINFLDALDDYVSGKESFGDEIVHSGRLMKIRERFGKKPTQNI